MTKTNESGLLSGITQNPGGAINQLCNTKEQLKLFSNVELKASDRQEDLMDFERLYPFKVDVIDKKVKETK